MSILCKDLSATNVDSNMNEVRKKLSNNSNMLSMILSSLGSSSQSTPPNEIKNYWKDESSNASLMVNDDGTLSLNNNTQTNVNYSLLKSSPLVWSFTNNNLSGILKDNSVVIISGNQNYSFSRVAPSEPRNLNSVAGDGYVDLSWDAPILLADSSLVSYKVYKDGVLAQTLFPSQTTVRISSLQNGLTYNFKVSATNAYGESIKSNNATATPSPPPPAVPTNINARYYQSSIFYYLSVSLIASAENSYKLYVNGSLASTSYYFAGQELIFNIANNPSTSQPRTVMVTATRNGLTSESDTIVPRLE
jgi:hypothetical protein